MEKLRLPSGLLSVKEVARYLAVTERTVYRLLKKNALPSFRVGGLWRFKRDILDDWVKSRHV